MCLAMSPLEENHRVHEHNSHSPPPFIATLVYNEVVSQTQFTAACLSMSSDKMKVELHSETKYQVRVVGLLVWGIVWLV